MNKKNQYIEVAYNLFFNGEDDLEMMEEATTEQPFQFITGFGTTLDAFEQQIAELGKGQTFDFTIPKEQAYGDYVEEHILDLEREMFNVDGRFDQAHIYLGATIPLENEEGQRFYGRVIAIGEKTVKVDLNHPLAGKDLHFKGTVLENREATDNEIKQLIAHLTGGCGCGDCEGHEHNCKGGCGHCH